MLFESSVNSDGSQTPSIINIVPSLFESSVNSDGSQTGINASATILWFESSVNSDGSQTVELPQKLIEVFESSVNSAIFIAKILDMDKIQHINKKARTVMLRADNEVLNKTSYQA